MMVSKKERASIHRFVCGELRAEPDLSTLTIGILKRRYLALLHCQSLSPEAKHFMKQVVQEELMKMQDNDKNESELETKKRQNKREREKENDEVISGGEDESTAKKSRYQSSSSSDSEDKDDRKTGGEESEEEEEEQAKSGSEDEDQEVKKSQGKTKVNSKHQINSEDSADEELNESEKDGEESNCGSSPEEMVNNKASTTKSGETGSSNTRQGNKKKQSDEENDGDMDNTSERSDQISDNNSTDDSEMEEKVSVEKPLPLDVEKDRETKDNKKKSVKKEKSTRGQQDDDKAVVRLKRYIALCGAWRNYKKLLDGCRSVRAKVAVLKKELEDLGVHGHPSIQKCKAVRKKREDDREIAELDVNNIIATEGRPRRRAAWQQQPEPRSSKYVCTLNSGSDSDEENNTHRGRRRAANWANLKGIISDDADSD